MKTPLGACAGCILVNPVSEMPCSPGTNTQTAREAPVVDGALGRCFLEPRLPSPRDPLDCDADHCACCEPQSILVNDILEAGLPVTATTATSICGTLRSFASSAECRVVDPGAGICGLSDDELAHAGFEYVPYCFRMGDCVVGAEPL